MSMSLAHFPHTGVSTDQPRPYHYRDEARALRLKAAGVKGYDDRWKLVELAMRFDTLANRIQRDRADRSRRLLAKWEAARA